MKTLKTFVAENQPSWKVTDHAGNTHTIKAKDQGAAKKHAVSVGGLFPNGIPMTQWQKVKVEPLREEYDYPDPGPETNAHKVGDKVIPKIGPHKGQVHTVIHVHPDGSYNIKPEVHVSSNKYRQGAARAQHKDLQ